MNPEENKVLGYLLKRYKRKYRNPRTTIANTRISGYVMKELEKY